MSLKRSIMALSLASVLCLSIQPALAANNQPTAAAAETTSHVATEQKVNINSASIDELKKVKGIGAAKAAAIVDYRTQHGPFKSVDGLSEVKGFSAKVVATLVQKNPGVMTIE
jgi:competence protein ComEA